MLLENRTAARPYRCLKNRMWSYIEERSFGEASVRKVVMVGLGIGG